MPWPDHERDVPENTCRMSLFTIYNALGDEKSETVFSSGLSGFVKRGHDSKYMRPHLTVFAPPLPSVVPIPVDLGLMAVVIAFGSAKTSWGPYAIKASIGGSAENPAVNLLPPFLFLGAANFVVCSDPTAMPNTFNVQPPNTVLAGMSFADVAGNLVSTLLDAVLSKLLNKLGEWGPVKEVMEKMTSQISVRLTGVLRHVLSERVMKAVTRMYLEEGEEGAEDVVKRPVTEFVDHGLDKLKEYVAGKLGGSAVVDGAGDKVHEAFGEEEGEKGGEGGERGAEGGQEPGGGEGGGEGGSEGGGQGGGEDGGANAGTTDEHE
jgi:hypothetical protein